MNKKKHPDTEIETEEELFYFLSDEKMMDSFLANPSKPDHQILISNNNVGCLDNLPEESQQLIELKDIELNKEELLKLLKLIKPDGIVYIKKIDYTQEVNLAKQFKEWSETRYKKAWNKTYTFYVALDPEGNDVIGRDYSCSQIAKILDITSYQVNQTALYHENIKGYYIFFTENYMEKEKKTHMFPRGIKKWQRKK